MDTGFQFTEDLSKTELWWLVERHNVGEITRITQFLEYDLATYFDRELCFAEDTLTGDCFSIFTDDELVYKVVKISKKHSEHVKTGKIIPLADGADRIMHKGKIQW